MEGVRQVSWDSDGGLRVSHTYPLHPRKQGKRQGKMALILCQQDPLPQQLPNFAQDRCRRLTDDLPVTMSSV